MNSRTIRASLAISLLSASTLVGAATRTNTPPNVMFDLSHFKLTLPVDSNGAPSGTAATIQNKLLNGSPGYYSSYFYTDSSGAMVFYSPTNGATTTPGSGSDHTRSELRELYRVNGPTEWTNSIGGTLTATCRVSKASTKSDEAVVGQIHGLSSILVIVDYNPIKKQVEAKVYPTPSSTRAQLYVLASNVALGTKFSYAIQWIGSTLSVSFNGKATNWVTDASWNGVPVYFKAGAYSSAPSTGNPASDATEVAFSHLQVQH